MYQSSKRNNFLDILLDPMAMAILGSIALHGIIAAIFPFLTQPEKPGKKAEPGTVKVVELTASELQRIPQAPTPVIPRNLPPVYQPSTPIPPAVPPVKSAAVPPVKSAAVSPTKPTAVPPRALKVSAAPYTIPSSPFSTPPKAVVKPPPTNKKDQKATPQTQPAPPTFDPKITFQPSPKPSKPPIAKGISPKPAPKPAAQPTPLPSQEPTPAATPEAFPEPSPSPSPETFEPITPIAPKVAVSPQPQATPGTDDDGDKQAQAPAQPQPSTPAKTTQPPTATPQPSPIPGSSPGAAKPPTDGDDDGDGNGSYGKYTQAANDKLREYLTKYPDIKTYAPKVLSQKYPAGTICPKVKKPPFIVLMVVFDKIKGGEDISVLGENSTSPLIENEKPYINGDPTTLGNKKLMDLASTAGFAEASAADRNRPTADKGKPVLYQYRVQFDPASCKN